MVRGKEKSMSVQKYEFRKSTQGEKLIWHKGLAVDPAELSTLCAFHELVWPKEGQS